MRRLFLTVLIASFTNISIAATLVIDGSSVEKFDKSLAEIALSLSEEERILFSQAVIKIGIMNIDLGVVGSRDEAKLKSRQQLSEVLDGKTYAEIMKMATKLPNDARFKAIKAMDSLITNPDFQHDADIERLKHLKYLAGMIEEYQKKKGHYPLTNETDIQNYVYIASPTQQRYTRNIAPPYEHKRITLEWLKSELENALGRKLIIPFDPQMKPLKKPNFYIYMTQKDKYFLTVYLHNGENIGTKVGPDYYKVELSNVAIEESGVITYEQLLENKEFTRRIAEKYILKRPKNPEQVELNL